MRRTHPPAGAIRLLRWAIARPETFEGVVGDLTEEFHQRLTSHGRWAARRAFWLQALWITLVFKARGRDVRAERHGRGSLMTGLLDELVHVGRSLARTPGFTFLAVAILALGIGTSTAVFEAFRSVALVDLPVTDPERIVALSLLDEAGAGVALVPDEIQALHGESQALPAIAGTLSRPGTMPVTEGDRPLVLDFAFVTARFFDVLGARPTLGRLFRPEDGAEGARPVAVISYRTWQREFASAPDVVGRTLTATQYQGSYEIIGVAPAGLDFPVGVDYWILPGARRQSLDVVARMSPSTTPSQAGSAFLAMAQAMDGERDRPSEPAAFEVVLLTDAVVGDARPLLMVVTAASLLLLLIACGNVAGLLLMRAVRRSRHLTVRRALGASSGRIARGFMLEGALLGIVAGGLGLILASSLLNTLPQVAPTEVPRTELIALGGAPMGVAALVTLLSVLLVATLPSLAATRTDIAAALRRAGRWSSSARGARHVRCALVGAQVALAVVVLFGAGLLMRTLQQLRGLDLGYESERVAVLELGIDRRGLSGPSELASLLEGVFDELRAIPGVNSVSPLMARPFTGGDGVFRTTPFVEGHIAGDLAAPGDIPLESGGSEIFETLGIPILQGRGFLERDREGAPNVAVVSERLADRWWPGDDPLGRRIRLSLGREEWWTVVGVVGETRFRQLREATPTIYLPWRQFQILPMAWTVAVRTDGDPALLASPMRQAVSGLDSRIYLWTIGSLREHLSRGPLAAPRTTAIVLVAFGLTALMLAAAGLYGIMALSVQEQTRELGIRRALGAPAWALRTDVMSDALRTTAVGSLLGLVVAMLGARLLAPLLFEVGPADPVTVAWVSAAILLVRILETYVHLGRARSVDRRVVLQEE